MKAELISSEPIAPQLFTALRDAIVQIRLKPGEALSEKHIAARFGVSRQPVRESFIKLAEIGLVDIWPSRGTYVTKISMREVADARLVREAIESDIAATAARLATTVDSAALDAIIGAQEQAAATGDVARFEILDAQFHDAIARIVDCDFAWRTVETARLQTDRVRHLSLPSTSPPARLIGQHRLVAAAIAAHDAEGARRAMRRHLREILIALGRIAAATPDYFADTELPAHAADLVPEDEPRARAGADHGRAAAHRAVSP